MNTSCTSQSPISSQPHNTVIEPVRRKGRRQKHVIHPIFVQASQYMNDSFWANQLMDAAKGVFPQGILYSKDMLVFTTKRKVESISLYNMSPEQVAEAFYTFIRKYTTMSSDNDDRLSKMELMTLHRDHRNVTNREIQSMLDEYATNFAKYFDLNNQQKDSLTSTLQIGYYMGIYNNKTVNIASGIITFVPHVEYDKNTGKFYITPEILKTYYSILLKSVNQSVSKYSGTQLHEMYTFSGRDLEKEWKATNEALNNIGPKPIVEQPSFF